MSAPAVYVLHDNPEWLPPIRAAFEAAGVPLVEWPLGEGIIALDEEPPQGVFWSRLSASSHTRGREGAKDQARATLRWLESWNRRVVNGPLVTELEVSKVAQHAALRASGFDVPRTVAVFGHDQLKDVAATFGLPFITKHNQGGKGLGVRLFSSLDEFAAYVDGPEFEEAVDGITLLQEYLFAREPSITRIEFVGGSFVYAVRVDTSDGGFELCPAEACTITPGQAGPAATPELDAEFCALDAPADRFHVRDDITADSPLVAQLEGFLARNGIEVAGVEFMETVDGRTVVYDINTNTNYNPAVETSHSTSAGRRVAEFLGGLLADVNVEAPRVGAPS